MDRLSLLPINHENGNFEFFIDRGLELTRVILGRIDENNAHYRSELLQYNKPYHDTIYFKIAINDDDDEEMIIFKKLNILKAKFCNKWEFELNQYSIDSLNVIETFNFVDEKYHLTKVRSSIFNAVEKNTQKKYSCLMVMSDVINDKEFFVPIIHRKNVFGINFVLTEQVKIIELKNTIIDMKRIFKILSYAYNKGYCLLTNFEDLVIYNNEIYIYKYQIIESKYQSLVYESLLVNLKKYKSYIKNGEYYRNELLKFINTNITFSVLEKIFQN